MQYLITSSTLIQRRKDWEIHGCRGPKIFPPYITSESHINFLSLWISILCSQKTQQSFNFHWLYPQIISPRESFVSLPTGNFPTMLLRGLGTRPWLTLLLQAWQYCHMKGSCSLETSCTVTHKGSGVTKWDLILYLATNVIDAILFLVTISCIWLRPLCLWSFKIQLDAWS